MKTITRLACLLAAGALVLAGCGGGDSGQEADTEAINQVVTDINQANDERDGAAYCELLQPSNFLETFDSMNECATETDQILEQAGDQPDLEVEDISIDGDTANVSFVGRSGEAPFVKEGDSWYLVLGQPASGTTEAGPAPEDSGSDSSGATGAEGGG
jgi:hypothetical protein